MGVFYRNNTRRGKRIVERNRLNRLKNVLSKEIQVEWEKDEANAKFYKKLSIYLAFALIGTYVLVGLFLLI